MENTGNHQMGTLISESTAPARARIPTLQSSNVAEGWRIVFAGVVHHPPTAARSEGCGAIAEWLPTSERYLKLYKHEDGEVSAFYF